MGAASLIESNDNALGQLNDIVGFHIRLAHGAVYRHFTETFVEDREALEDAGLLSKEKLLAGDIMPGFAGDEQEHVTAEIED